VELRGVALIPALAVYAGLRCGCIAYAQPQGRAQYQYPVDVNGTCTPNFLHPPTPMGMVRSLTMNTAPTPEFPEIREATVEHFAERWGMDRAGVIQSLRDMPWMRKYVAESRGNRV
jgi:hypothetical protein